MSIISQIVGRCHVADSDLSVVRYALSRLKHGRKTFLQMPKKMRREFIQTIITEHHDNQQLFKRWRF